MKIRTSAQYYHRRGCELSDCDRAYCAAHRLLYRVCETAHEGTEGDREVGLHTVWEISGECPEC